MSVFSTKLLKWHHVQNRLLPWREATPDPYKVWLAEIMLQQTTFATVTNRFKAFLEWFPDVESLASASQAEVLQHWAGLGYYARARNLHRCAQIIVCKYHGIFPNDIPALRTLPGIGDYTAAAIAAIAFDQSGYAIDSNIKRIFARFTRYEKPVTERTPELLDFFDHSQRGHSPRHHLEAWLDFGETLCRARNPDCPNCPVREHCLGHDIAETLPIKTAKKPRRQLHAYGYWLTNADGMCVWLRRRPQKGLLAGMLEIPTSDWQEKPAQHPHLLPAVAWRKTGQTIQHRFTHLDLNVDIVSGTTEQCLDSFGLESGWYPVADIPRLGLASLMKKIVGAMYSKG